MIELVKEVLKTSIKDTKLKLLWLGIIPLLPTLIALPEKKCPPWLLEILKNTLTTKILISLCILAMGFALSFLILYLKTKPKIKIDEFKLQPEGYFTNPKYEYDAICPKCLHVDPPKVVPMTQASGPWKCVSCDAKISQKAACASSPPLSRREGFVNNWRR